MLLIVLIVVAGFAFGGWAGGLAVIAGLMVLEFLLGALFDG